jgi:hypothetical protein
MLGIRPIQDHAIRTSNMLRFTKAYEPDMNPVWSIDEKIEIFTRVLVRTDMMLILSDLGEELVGELSYVLFNIVYPTYEKPVEM